MKWPKIIVFVRHPESEGSAVGQEQRAAMKIPNHAYRATERGRKQAEFTRNYLRGRFSEFDAYLASTFIRTQELVSLLYPGALVKIDPRLNEKWDGIFHQLSREEIDKEFPSARRVRERDGWYHHRAPGGENGPDVEFRIRDLNRTLCEEYAGKQILIGCHGRWLILFQRHIHGFPPEEAERRQKTREYFAPASVTIYTATSDGNHIQLIDENIVPWQGKID